MRKWLSMCGAIALTTTSASVVVSCNGGATFVAKDLDYFPNQITYSEINDFVTQYNSDVNKSDRLLTINNGAEIGTMYIYLMYDYSLLGARENIEFLRNHRNKSDAYVEELLTVAAGFSYDFFMADNKSLLTIDANTKGNPSHLRYQDVVAYCQVSDPSDPGHTVTISLNDDINAVY